MPWWMVGGRGTLEVTGDGCDLLIREPCTLSSMCKLIRYSAAVWG